DRYWTLPVSNSLVQVNANATIDSQVSGASTNNNAYQFNDLTINGSTLSIVGNSIASRNFNLNFAGVTNINGAATFNQTMGLASFGLLGQVVDHGNAVTVAGTGITRLNNTAAGSAANDITGTWTINGGLLHAYAPAAGSAAAGSNSLGTAAIVMSGANPIL